MRKERELTLRIMLAWLNSYLFPKMHSVWDVPKNRKHTLHTHTHTHTHTPRVQRHIPLPWGAHGDIYTADEP